MNKLLLISMVTLLVQVFCCFELKSQVNTEELSNELIDQGFQNVFVSKKGSLLQVYYENRIYRFEIDGLKKVMEALWNSNIEGIKYFRITILKRGLPMVELECLNDEKNNFYQNLADLKVNQGIKHGRIQNGKLNNKGQYKFELEVEPQFRFSFGGFPDPVVHQFNLLPSLKMYLWKGATLEFQGVLPILDEFDIPAENFVRPRVFGFNQYLRLPANSFVGVSAGYFTNNSYGAELEVSKFLLNGNLLIRSKIGYTGFASFPKIRGYDEPQPGWQIADLEVIDYRFNLDYRFPQWDLIVQLEYGKYISPDKVARLTVRRQFGEITFGFFAFIEDLPKKLSFQNDITPENNYGFHLSIPLFPKKYHKPGLFQIKPSRFIQYTYHAAQYFPTQYDSGNNIWNLTNQLNPSFIQNQLYQGK